VALAETGCSLRWRWKTLLVLACTGGGRCDGEGRTHGVGGTREANMVSD